MKYQKNKKAAFQAEALVQFFSFIALLLVIIIFATLFSLRAGHNKTINQQITSSSNSIDYDYILLTYLRLPVNIDGNEMEMTDLIIRSYMNNDYKELDKLTKEYFEKVQLSGADSWMIKVNDHQIQTQNYDHQTLVRKFILPSHIVGDLIVIELYTQDIVIVVAGA